jgi:hypothetical protein
MLFRWIIKLICFLLAVLGIVVTGIMYTKLSFIDWPYLIGGAFFLAVGIFVPVQKKN